MIARSASLGVGIAVMAGAVINSSTTIGDFAIINTTSSIDHDCVIDNYASVAPGAVLGGSVRIGEGAIVSIGASIRHKISVGEHALIGAGAVLLQDCEPYSVWFGCPARYVRERSEGDSYL